VWFSSTFASKPLALINVFARVNWLRVGSVWLMCMQAVLEISFLSFSELHLVGSECIRRSANLIFLSSMSNVTKRFARVKARCDEEKRRSTRLFCFFCVRFDYLH
jgi:hypothetical protein